MGLFLFLKHMWYYVYILKLNNGHNYVVCTISLKERYARRKKDMFRQPSRICR